MPGWSNSTNLFGVSDFIVGTILGDGVNYTSVQTAINDAVAVGNAATIYIRPGTYTENILLANDVNLVGCTTLGQGAQVRIDGLVTVPVGGSCQVRGIQFTDGGNAQTVLANGGGGTVTFTDCTISSVNNAAFAMVDSDVTLFNCQVTATNDGFEFTGGAVVRMLNCRVDGTGFVFDQQATGSIFADTCILVSGAGGVLFDSGGGNIEISRSQLIANAAPAIDMQVGGTCILNYNNITSVNQAISFNAAGPLVRSFQNSYVIGAGSEYVVGGGQYEYCSDAVSPQSANGIDNATTQVKFGWRPWAETDLAPGTFSVRGTSSYDSTQFVVTDGFVQTNFTGIFPWVDQALSTTVVVNQGNFVTASITLTLPGAPAQGDTVKFKVVGIGAVLVIQADAGQLIQLGQVQSSVAGTATSSFFGDTMDLTYYAAAATWVANSSIGNWTFA